MAVVQRFEEIEAWREARKLTHETYRATGQSSFHHDTGLREQMRRASVSIMANIAEGFDGGSNQEFLRFLGYAFRSASELQSHLYVALDAGHLTGDLFDTLYGRAEKVKGLVGGFVRYLRSCGDS
jgi:four helix bundle protein